ncbi:SDR family NAD(P)-dependent oxidoreductase [Haloferula sargassicola]|uniref:Sulfoacetaldehyde reductase n=1 Tax=Haloferula sargassicola TaxID=490096 RepID=A0ABP9UPR5_9BACT
MKAYRCALITGASSGLGAEFARQLAGRCQLLVLTARRETLLERLADGLRGAHPSLEVVTVAADITDPADRQRILAACGACAPDLLVNNAGMGDYGDFTEAKWSKLEAMLRLNVEALTAMSHAVAPRMIAHGGGDMIQVSSLASLLPIPDFAVYAATKAYVSSFSEALRIELREHGIRVTALCPGPVHTGFGEVAARDGKKNKDLPMREWSYVDASTVVSEALDGVELDRPRVYPGLKIAAAAALLSLLPLALIRLAMSSRPRR